MALCSASTQGMAANTRLSTPLTKASTTAPSSAQRRGPIFLRLATVWPRQSSKNTVEASLWTTTPVKGTNRVRTKLTASSKEKIRFIQDRLSVVSRR